MTEYIVTTLVIAACIVIGLTILGEAENRIESRVPQPLHIAQMMDAVAAGDGGEPPSSTTRWTETQSATAGLEEPRILARREACQALAPADNMSDDVLNRYRYFAQDLEKLRTELAYSPPRVAYMGQQRISLKTAGTHPVSRGSNTPRLGFMYASARIQQRQNARAA